MRAVNQAIVDCRYCGGVTASPNRVFRAFIAGTDKAESDSEFDPSDGRVANRLRNREMVLDAYVDLVTEGETASLDQLVERSGIARRSVLRYFADLAMEGFRRVVAEAAPDATFGPASRHSLNDRATEATNVRMRMLG